MTFVCPNCKAVMEAQDRFCRACGTALSTGPDALSVSGNDPIDPHARASARFGSIALPFGLKLADVFAVLAYGAGGLLVLLLSYHLFSQAFSFATWELIVASLAVVVVVMKVYSDAGLSAILHYGIYLSIYCAGGLAVLAITAASSQSHDAWPPWQIWLIYTGVYSLLLAGLPPLLRRMVGPARDQARFRAIADEAEEAHMRREAALTQLPSHSWYLLACWVTGVAMVGSFATTAIGFYEEIVDPYAPSLIRFGIPIGLSAMAAFIIWSGWNFVFLRMRVDMHVWSRILAFMVGFAILVPLTLAIHTVFGIIGVGGTEGLRAHYMWYADVLSGYQKRADDLRQVELGFLAPLEQMGTRFKKLADDETNPAAKAKCGIGQGDLWKYYSDRFGQVDSIVKQISARRDSSSDLPKSIETLRKQIRDPGKDFRSAQEQLESQFNTLRSETVALEGRSVMNSIHLFMSQLAIVVEQETFFSNWSSCQARSKDQIKEEIGRFLTEVRKVYDGAEGQVVKIKGDAIRQIPRERRIESFPLFDQLVSSTAAPPAAAAAPADANKGVSDTIPIFLPLRPFWAVVSYAGQLPGYVALQLALDFSPAILGLLFAVMAPVPAGPTRLGLLTKVAADNLHTVLKRHLPENAKDVRATSAENAGAADEAAIDAIVAGPAASDTARERDGDIALEHTSEPKVRIHPPVSVDSGGPQDAKVMSVYARISGQRDCLFDDLGRCEALLNDTLLSQPEVDALMVAAKAGIPQSLLARPSGVVDSTAVDDAADRLSRDTALDVTAAREVVTMWIQGLGLRSDDSAGPAPAATPRLSPDDPIAMG
jgi:hypothetical protein